MVEESSQNSPAGRVPTSGFSNYLVPAGVLLVGIILTLAVWDVVRQHEYDKTRIEFELLVNQTIDTIQHRMKANIQVLRGAEGLFSANHQVGRDVSRAEFKAYVASLKLDERYPGILGVGFSKLIRPEQLGNHLRTIRAEGFPDYALRPPGDRKLYSSIIYLEPFDWRNQRAFGYDMYSDQVRQRAMERARKTGVAVLSDRVTLVQETDKEVQAGVLMYLPLYRGGNTPTDEDQRLEELIGWAYSPLRMKDLMSNLIERDLPSTKDQIAFSIYDGERADPAALLFTAEEVGSDQASLFHTSRKLEIAGQTWFLTASALPGFQGGEDIANTRLIWEAGLSISLLLAFISLMQVRNAARLSVAAGQLQESETRFRYFFEKNKSVMLLIEPTTGAIIEANHAASTYYGYEQQRLTGMNISDINISDINMLPSADIALERQLALKEVRNYFNFRHRLASGELRDVEVYSTPIDASGKPLLFSVIHDVSQRKQQEIALREAVERLSIAQKDGHAGFWDWDVSSGKLTWTPEFFLLFGLDPATTEASFDTWRSALHPEDIQATESNIADAIRDHTALQNEYRIVWPTGEVRWIYASGNTSYNQLGHPLRMSGICIDITERKKVEERLFEREAELRRANENIKLAERAAKAGAYSWNFTTGETQWTDEFFRLFGLDPSNDKASYETWQKSLHPDDLKKAEMQVADAIRDRKPLFQEYRVVHPDGSARWIAGHGDLKYDDAGEPSNLIGFCIDITERKKAESKLLQSQNMLQDAQRIARVGSWEVDFSTNHVYWSEELYRMQGLDPKSTTPPDYTESAKLFTPESWDLLSSSIANTSESGVPYELELEIVKPDGSHGWMLARGEAAKNDLNAVTGVRGVALDITARKKIDDIQNFLAKTTSSHLGETFFEELARYLSQSLGMFYVCIDRLEGDGLNATTLAIWCDDKFEDNVTYALKDTPCGDVVGQKVCCFPASVCQCFPRDQVLQNLCAESYIGVTLFGHSGQPIGLIAVIGREPLENRPLAESILKLVAIRSEGELERLFTEERLQLSSRVFTHAREGILITEADGTILEVNEAFSRITGYSRDEVVGMNPRILSSGRQSKEFYAALWLDLHERGYWSGEVWNRRKNGEVYAELLTISAVNNTEGKAQHYVALFSDISDLKEHEQQLEHIAHYDTLTNLPSRALLADRLNQGITQAQRRNQGLAVAYLDLDGFKEVNDSHGHDVGDELLMVVANRMKDSLREGDTIARIGGDEFVAVLLDLTDIESCVPMLNRLLSAAAASVEIGGKLLRVSASIGVTFYPQAGSVDADQLVRQADQAMYQAKLEGRNRYSVFDAEHDSSVRGLHESLDEISRALLAREFVLHYQPKVNMVGGEIIGAEALIRWQHPKKGLLPPGVFLPAIEEHLLSVKIGEWVIDTALKQIALWQKTGLDIPVSVNVGALQLQQAGFVEQLRVVLAAHPDVKPSFLEIEVLETSAVKDIARVSQVMDECREIGVSFALDDFGTGYSSLTYLHHLPISKIKIDQSFVRDLTLDPSDQVMVKTIIDMGKNFTLNVIAEGVETEDQLMLLKQLGCMEYQGYFFSKPVPAEQFEALLKQR